MVLLNQGRTRLRNALTTDFSSGQAGTGVFPPEIDQTGLFAAIAATLNTLSTKLTSSDTITVTHVVTTGEANNSYLSEWEVLGNSDTVDYNRIVLSGLLKRSNTEVTMIHSFALERV